MTAWWNAAGDCCPPEDAAGRMVFDLNGAANFTRYSGPDAEGETGNFVLDVENQTLNCKRRQYFGWTRRLPQVRMVCIRLFRLPKMRLILICSK